LKISLSSHTGNKEQDRLLRAKYPEVFSHKFERYRSFGTNLLWMAVIFYILFQQGDCSCVIFS